MSKSHQIVFRIGGSCAVRAPHGAAPFASGRSVAMGDTKKKPAKPGAKPTKK